MEPPTSEEIVQLDELRKRIADLKLSEEDNSYKNLVRFLRARNGNLDAVEQMIRNNQEWRLAENVKSILSDFEYPEAWENDFQYTMTGFDKEGNPLLIAPFGTWDMQKEMALGNKEEFIKFVHHHMEKGFTALKRLSKEDNYMKQAVGIVDLEGLSFRQVTNLDVIEAAIRCLKTFEANYPETVKNVVVVNVPWAFQFLWKLVKPFLSDHTHSKLNFVGSDKEKWREAVLKFADSDQFPEFYGGTAPISKKYFIARDGSCTLSENQNDSADEDFQNEFDDSSESSASDQQIVEKTY